MKRGAPLPVVLACWALALAAHPAPAATTLDGLLAPSSACPRQSEPAARVGAQERAMRCLVNHARSRSALHRLRAVGALGRSAGRKSLDIVRCDSFSHGACGRDFTYWIKRFGYPVGGCWRAAENIAWGTGAAATPRSIFAAWMRSSGHRQNILDSDFRDFGVGLKVGELDGNDRAHVWTQHFGARC